MDSVTFNFLKAVLSVFGLVGLSVTLSVGVAFILFRYFGSKWIEAKFAERLADYNHAKNREIEKLKFQINSLIDRKLKSHEKEFEYLPSTWALFNDAFDLTYRLLGGLRTHPNFTDIKPETLELFIELHELPRWIAEELRSASDKFSYWHHFLDREDHRKAMIVLGEFRLHISKYAIFYSDEIREEFDKAASLLWSVTKEHKDYVVDGKRPISIKNRDDLLENGPAILSTLERVVRDRLWNAETEKL